MFDALTRTASQPGSRRAALITMLGGLLGLTSSAAAADRRDRKHRRRTKRRIKRLRRKTRNQPPPPGRGLGTTTCAGTNGCGDMQCQAGGATCFCRINAQTGETFCGGSAYDVLNCSQCGANTICVNLSACGGAGAVGCAAICG